MPSDMQIDLSKTRLQIAKERLAFAEEILKLGDYKTVANRSYYAVFAAMRAVLALQGFDSKKHSGIIAEFRREYIKSGLLPKELSPIIEALVEIRQGSDYDDFYLISKEEVEEQLHNAQQVVRIVEASLLTQYPKSTYRQAPPDFTDQAALLHSFPLRQERPI